MNIEKVFYGLRCMCYGDVECKECHYAKDGSGWHDCRSNCAKDALAMLKEQEGIIKQYQKADGFLFAHGWKWENYIDTREEPHPIEVGDDGLPY